MPSVANLTARNYEIYFKGEHLGHIVGGVEYLKEREWTSLKTDYYSADVDRILKSENLTIKFSIAEIVGGKLEQIMQECDTQVGATDTKVYFGKDPGFSLRGVAGELRLHPQGVALSDDTKDFYLYKAASVDAVKIPFTVEEQSLIEVTFMAFIDETRGDGRRLGHYGPNTIS